MDADLSRVKDLRDADSFVSTLDRIVTDTLTNDFWNITVANDLETSSARSPAHFGYLAAQNRLGAPVLFSDKKIAAGKLRFVLPDRIGHVVIRDDIPLDRVREAVESLRG